MILFCVGVISSLFFVIDNFIKTLEKNCSIYKKIFVIMIEYIIVLIFIFYFFFNNSIIKSGNFQVLKNKYDISTISNSSNNFPLKKPIIISNKDVNYVININKDKASTIGRNEKMEKTGKLEKIVKIGIAADNNRIYQALVLLTSLMENIGPNTKYELYILLCLKTKVKLEQILNSLFEKYEKNKLMISYITMNDSDYFKSTVNKFVSKSAYYRINFASLLPNYDKIIYLDIDIINFHDLSNLYQVNLKDDRYIGAALNYAGFIKEIRSMGVPAEFEVNSGVLLLNLKAFRKYNVENKIKKLADNKYLNHFDETAINAVCFNNTEILPIKYNVQRGFYNLGYEKFKREFKDKQNEKYRYKNEELFEAYYNPVNLHFAGYHKPWNKKENIQFKEYWWYYANHTKYMNEIMNLYGYNNAEINEILSKVNKRNNSQFQFNLTI